MPMAALPVHDFPITNASLSPQLNPAAGLSLWVCMVRVLFLLSPFSFLFSTRVCELPEIAVTPVGRPCPSENRPRNRFQTSPSLAHGKVGVAGTNTEEVDQVIKDRQVGGRCLMCGGGMCSISRGFCLSCISFVLFFFGARSVNLEVAYVLEISPPFMCNHFLCLYMLSVGASVVSDFVSSLSCVYDDVDGVFISFMLR